jgi:hypothetical protein
MQAEATAATAVPLSANAPVGMGDEIDDMHQQVDMLRAERDALNASLVHTRAVVSSQEQLLEQQNRNAASMAVAAAHQAGLLAQTGASGPVISVQKLLGQMQLPEYDPRTHNAEVWFYRLEQYMGLCVPRPSSADMISLASLRLRGAALDWWRSLSMTGRCPNTWEAFKQALKGQFQTLPPVRVARDKLAIARQVGSVAQYVAHVRALHCVIADISEAEKMDRFERGLKPHLQQKVRVAHPPPTTFEAMTELALTFDAAERAAQGRSHEFRSRAAVSQNTHESFSQAPMEIDALSVKAKKSKRPGGGFKGRCFSCNEYGHRAGDCPKGQKGRQSK